MIGRSRRGFVAVVSLLVTIGCGGGGGGGGTSACTQNSGSATAMTCVETHASYSVSTLKADCTDSGGVASDACSHVGADGGCKTTDSSGGATIAVTSWYYTGNASTEMAQCLSAGSVWIAP